MSFCALVPVDIVNGYLFPGEKTYDDLIMTNVGTPRVLVLLVLPPNEDDWLVLDEDRLLLRRCAYRLSLEGRPATSNETRITLGIPRDKRFSVEALQRIMATIRRGDRL